MVAAILKESDMLLSDELLTMIIDKVSVFGCNTLSLFSFE